MRGLGQVVAFMQAFCAGIGESIKIRMVFRVLDREGYNGNDFSSKRATTFAFWVYRSTRDEGEVNLLPR